ncbi:MAG TPA: helix-turn-helix transcriptional regulator, partial [Aldersonia sp.]
GERFARAAVERGGGLRATELLARTLLWQGRPDEAEAALADFAPDTLDQPQLISWGGVRIGNLFFVAQDAEKADEVLALLKERVTHPPLALIVTAWSSPIAAFENRLEEALAASEDVLARPDALPWAVEHAAFGGMVALALMGRGSEVAPMASRFHEVMNMTDGLLRYPASLGEMLGMILTGELDLAQRRADESNEFSSAGHFLAWAMANILLGMVDLAKGRLPDAATRNEQALAALVGDKSGSWAYPARITLVQAYAALGKVEDAQRALADAQARFGRHVAIFGPQLRLAEAWLAAAEGTVTPAIAKAHMAAAEAAEAKQYAVEADVLHTAARFGDKTVWERLAELAGDLDGKLIEVHARHAQAVAADDGAALDSAAAEYERLGALLSAADAAAQAASAHERAEGRGGAAGMHSRRAFLESAAAANRLAAACGGAATPTLRAAAQPLPLTVREREIANLVAAGLSNKEIAERLTVSVRTVEGHLYRACAKLDVADREALADLLRSAG